MPGFFEWATLAAMLFYGLLVLPFVLLGLAIPYAVLRLRDRGGEAADQQIGVKVGLYYFFSLSILIALLGLNVVSVDLVVDWHENPR